MGLVRCAVVASVVLVTYSVAARGDDALPAATVQRLKDATVYVKTEIGPIAMSGSGFVIQVTGDTALIVTNQHVIAKPRELRVGGYIPGLRGRDKMAIRKLQVALASQEPVVSVVFNSGNGNEQTIKADILGALDEPDLAVLKVAGIRNLPKPIEFQQSAAPVETMPVYMLGFPFGDALATNKGNPTITIGKGSVSSIRKDAAGKLAKVQIDGALNPGNSGGPVVDTHGNLVGIAVQTIQGSNIGLAIPPNELAAVLEGRVGKPSIIAGSVEKGNAPKYEILVPLIDPLKKLKSVSVQFADGAVPFDAAKVGQPQLQAVAGSQKIDLPLNDRVARAEIPLPATSDQKAREVTVQASFVNQQGQTVHLEPVVVKVAAPVVTTTTIVSRNGNSATATQTTKTPNGTFRREVTITRGGSAPSKMSKLKAKDKDQDEDAAANDDDDEEDEPKTEKKKKSGKDKDKGSGEKPSGKAPEFGWTNKISKMKKIPDDEVTGQIDGVKFELDRATLSNGWLTLRKGSGFFADAEIKVTLFTKPNEDVSGRKVIVNGRVRAGDPHVHASSKRKGDKLPNTNGHLDYLMVLEFGEYDAESRVQPGKIYICLPDRARSFLAGSFEAAVD